MRGAAEDDDDDDDAWRWTMGGRIGGGSVGAKLTWTLQVSSDSKLTMGVPPLANSTLFCGRNLATTACSDQQTWWMAKAGGADVVHGRYP